MPGLVIHTANHLAPLLDTLARTLSRAPLPPMIEEIIVVQSQGMRRWLTLGLARALGCAASLSLPFPSTFCNRLSEQAGGENAGDSLRPFDRSVLLWRLLAAFEADLEGDSFADLRAYVAGADQLTRYHLARRLAGSFDDYELYRPDVLLEWEAGKVDPGPAIWQAALWRQLTSACDADHLAARFTGLLARLQEKGAAFDRLPSRVSVFGVATLPPVFIELLRALGRHAEVSLYLFHPSPDEEGRAPGKANPLLASLWRQGRDYFDLLAAGRALWAVPVRVDPGSETCLALLQSDILHGRDRRPGGDVEPHPLASDDLSLQVHTCHSPLREMEVLRDVLLQTFETDHTLRPSDVLVLVPDIELYAPYIQAVFGVEHQGTPALPYRVADRSQSREAPLIEGFLSLLRLAGGRLGSAEVMDLLQTPALGRQAGLASDELPVLRDWVRDTNIRWGADGLEKNARFQLPPSEANTWRAGLDRLMMGYCVGDQPVLVSGVLPFGEAGAGQADLLGRFTAFTELLFRKVGALRKSRPPADWTWVLTDLVQSLFAPFGEDEEQAQAAVLTQVSLLVEEAAAAGTDTVLKPEVVLEHLEASFSDDSFGRGFLSGTITFCALKPMRTIPFPVIAVAGLDESSFPRRVHRPSFDLQDLHPRKGDRDIRGDDRQLFLETILAAGRRLILSCVGRSRKDNSVVAPSVVLAELLDHLDRTFSVDHGQARDLLVTEHRLQPFHRAYFRTDKDPGLFSYSRENCAAAEAEPMAEVPFIQGPVPHAADRVLDLGELMRCWENPCRFFCRQTLMLRPATADDDLVQREAFSIDGLEAFRLGQEMVEAHVDGIAGTGPLMAARGDLPPGPLGLAWQERVRTGLGSFFEELGTPTFLTPRAFTLRRDGWVLSGSLDHITDKGRLLFRAARRSSADLVRAFLSHLVLNVMDLPDVPRTTILLNREDGAWVFPPLDGAWDLLLPLLDGYSRSLGEPLPFFPKASYAYGRQVHQLKVNTRASADPMTLARKAWTSGNWNRGDDQDPYITLCFRGREPLDEKDFTVLAEAFWNPVFAHGGEV